MSTPAAQGEDDVVGDPACWMANVCPVCGRFLEEPFADRGCAHCGAPAPAPESVHDGAEPPPDG